MQGLCTAVLAVYMHTYLHFMSHEYENNSIGFQEQIKVVKILLLIPPNNFMQHKICEVPICIYIVI